MLSDWKKLTAYTQIFSLLVLTWFGLLPCKSFAYESAPNCVPNFLSPSAPVQEFKVQPPSSTDALEMLEKAIRNKKDSILQKQVEYDRKINPARFADEKKPGEIVTVQGVEYKVLSLIGSGAEGLVYVVENNGKKFSIKEFRTLSELYSNVLALREINYAGVSSLRDIAVQKEKRLVVFPYVNGLTVLDIRCSFPKEINLINKANVSFDDMWYSFQEEYKARMRAARKDYSFVFDYNVIYDVDSRRFVIIDPW